jgi:hypothetical protein
LEYVGAKIKKGYNKLADKFRNKSASEMYDAFAKGASVTGGVGSGAASAVNATAVPDEKDKNKVDDNNTPETADDSGDMEE